MEKNQIIDQLYLCAAECIHCRNECLSEENNHHLQRCMKLDQDCADICTLSATLLERSSENAGKLLSLCIEICEACAEECEKHPHEHCQHCAEICSTCAKMCQRYQV